MFKFTMTAHKYFREGFIEIKMQYRFGDYEDWNVIAELVPEERFHNDKRYAERIIDNLFDRSRREVKNKMSSLTQKENQ